MIVGSGEQLKLVMNDTTRYSENVGGSLKEKEEPWSMLANNIYNENFLWGCIAASALKKAPIIAEISAGSGAPLGASKDILRGLNQLNVTLENILAFPDPVVIIGRDGKTYNPIPLGDAMVFYYLDHFVFGDVLKECGGDFNKALKETERIFTEVAKIPHLAGGMIDAGAVPYEQNLKVSKMVVDILRGAGKFVEAEYSATGGLGEEASGTERQEKTTATTRPGVVDRIRKYREEVNPDALAYDAGTTHVAAVGQKAQLDWDLIAAVQEADIKAGTFSGYPIHGGSSAEDYELGLRRGLYWKINKATEPKRNAMRAQAAWALANLRPIMADIDGNVALTGIGDSKSAKKAMDNAHHPKYIEMMSRETTMLFVSTYLDVVGSTGKSPYLREEVLKIR